jgi:subtilisin family serine protease
LWGWRIRRRVMEREYYKRGQRVIVEELPDVKAVQLSANERGVPRVSAESFGTSAVETVRSSVTRELPEDEDPLAPFERANWRFVTPSAEMARALAPGADVPDAEQVGKVIVGRSGSVAIATNRLSVQLQPELSEQECAEILSDKNLEVLTKLNFAPNLYDVVAHGREDALATSVELHEDERFTLAEPAFTEHIPQRVTPNDPRFTEQWQWKNTGQNGGTNGADVSAEEAWDSTLGAGIRVAVIDNGFDADHEDLAAGVSPMSGFFSPVVGGAATFTKGAAGMPDSDHGTFCAGIVGARHDNGTGGCGIAPECELMLIACLEDQVGTQTTLARAVGYATNPENENVVTDAGGADILVSSLGPNGAEWDLTVTLELALEAAGTNGRNGRGLPIFWAASNGRNVDVTLDEVVSQDDVIAVVRSDSDDRENNAARGKSVDLIAPGVEVFSTYPGDDYGTGTGTSYAAPCAAGCAALASSANPDLTRDELRQVMFDSADKIGGVTYEANGHNDDYGFGRVNAKEAVAKAAGLVPSTVPEDDTVDDSRG